MAQTLEKVNEGLDQQVLNRTRELLEAKASLEAELEKRRRAEIERQSLQQQVLDLSCPIIPISNDILVMPLIGVLDEARASFMMQTALERVAKRSAAVMIIDITGVSEVNATVASNIIDTARALRLLGTQTLLTGIRVHVNPAQGLGLILIFEETAVKRSKCFSAKTYCSFIGIQKRNIQGLAESPMPKSTQN